MVAARADNGITGLGWAGAVHGALYTGDAGGEPDESKTVKEPENIEKAAAKNGGAECRKTINVIFLGLTLSQ